MYQEEATTQRLLFLCTCLFGVLRPEDNIAKLYMRVFYNEDGSTAYNEYVNGDNSMFVFKDRILYSKQSFIAYFMEKLQLSQEDMILLDRSKDIGQVMIENKNQAKLGVVIHAEHYNASTTNDDYILWNNHYEYVFTNAQEMISLSQQQKSKINC